MSSNRPTRPTDKTAAEWRAEAADCRRREAESWERSDNDGFLSQWAMQRMAHRYDELAKLAENGGLGRICKLADAEGELIEGARYVETRYGWSWVYDGPTGAVWCRPSNHSNPEVARQRDIAKGFQEVWVEVPVVMWADGSITEDRMAVTA